MRRVRYGQGERIKENSGRFDKRNPVLSEIRLRLFGIPLKLRHIGASSVHRFLYEAPNRPFGQLGESACSTSDPFDHRADIVPRTRAVSMQSGLGQHRQKLFLRAHVDGLGN